VSIVLNAIKLGYHYVSETGSVSFLRFIKLGGGERLKDKKVKNGIKPTQLGPLEGANLNHWTCPVSLNFIHLRTGTEPVSETL
jgi:hypothetical protein